MTQYSGKVIRKTPVTPTQASASGVWKLNEQAAAIRNNTWPIAGVPDPISRSVRLRSSASGYFARTPSINGNRTTWTWSGWVKRGSLGSGTLFTAGLISGTFYYTTLGFGSDQLVFANYNDTNAGWLTTTQLFRDPSAWYHIVAVFDSTNATNTERMRLYVNGSRVTAFSTGTFPTTYPSQNTTSQLNTTSYTAWLGSYVRNGGSGSMYDGYFADINFIDGQALTPSSFGTTDPLTGAWIPMQYTGSYGTNGFYLDFKDNTSTTTIGYDYSGNSNNWTANNVSLTAGVTYDSMLDVPTPWIGYSATTDTSAVTRGNYAVMNAVAGSAGTYNAISNGNLRLSNTTTSGTSGTNISPFVVSSGKWYWEVTATGVPAAPSNPGVYVGIADSSNFLFGQPGGNGPASVGGYAYRSYTGNKVSAGGDVSYGATYTTNDVIGVALDLTAGTLTFYKNNVSQGTAYTGLTGSYGALGSVFQGGQLDFNFGQRPFTYTPPTGFKTLCATNLPTPTILNGASYMAATTYTGTGSTQSISNAVNGVSFQPDLVWFKSRAQTYSHAWFDSVRGVTKGLQSDGTNAEVTSTAGNDLSAFTSTGFTVGAPQNWNSPNNASSNPVAWQWRASGTTVSNTTGSITSTVSVNTTAGFSVVTYTGTGANATVGHGLGAVPAMMIVKNRSQVSSWRVYQKNANASPASGNLFLQATNAFYTDATCWNNTAPTSSVFSVGTSGDTNASGIPLVAYCFSEVAGYSAFNSYTGNGSADGPFVYTGFRPRWVMVKATSGALHWWVWDTGRNTYNAMNEALVPDLNVAEQSPLPIDCLSNGFKLRTSNGEMNTNGTTFIYAAFAENPFKYSNAR